MSKPTDDRIAPLCAAWPKAFTTTRPRPLKLGIHLDMLASGKLTAEQISQNVVIPAHRSGAASAAASASGTRASASNGAIIYSAYPPS
jgi:hypothetical protein